MPTLDTWGALSFARRLLNATLQALLVAAEGFEKGFPNGRV